MQGRAGMSWNDHQDLICPLFVSKVLIQVYSCSSLSMALRQESPDSLFLHFCLLSFLLQLHTSFPLCWVWSKQFWAEETPEFPAHSTDLSLETSSDVLGFFFPFQQAAFCNSILTEKIFRGKCTQISDFKHMEGICCVRVVLLPEKSRQTKKKAFQGVLQVGKPENFIFLNSWKCNDLLLLLTKCMLV